MFSPKSLIIILIVFITLPKLIFAINNDTNIENIINEANNEGISVVYNPKGRTLPFLFNPLASVITSMTGITLLKIGFLYTTTVWLLTIFFPKALATMGVSNGLLFARSSRTTPLDFDLEMVYKALNTISEKLANHLHIPEPECRYRAVCESSTFIAKRVSILNDWAKQVSGAFFLNLANPYSRAWINGMMEIDCATTYSQCYESPFKSILNKVVAKRR